MGNVIIGRLKNGGAVGISETSPNHHIALFGISGSGKSTRINDILLSLFENGKTIIVFDMAGMDFYPDGAIKGIDGTKLNKISAIDDGISLQFLDGILDSSKSRSFNRASYIAGIIPGALRLGDQQSGALIEAVMYAASHKGEHGSEMAAVAKGLELQGTPTARSLSNKLGGILQCGILRDDGKKIEKGKVNVISFKEISPAIQKNLAETVLALIWRMLRSDSTDMGDTAVVMDEFQHLSLKGDSALLEMLRESRKYNVSMVLATQTFSSFQKEALAAIRQTAVQLYFQPTVPDVKKISSYVSPGNTKEFEKTLRSLPKGVAVATGNLVINGAETNGPIITRSSYKGNSDNL